MKSKKDGSKQIKWPSLKMIKFFYYFLFILMVFSGNHHADTFLINFLPLKRNDLEISPEELKRFKNVYLQIPTLDDTVPEENELSDKSELISYDGMQKPASFYSHNFQRYPFPANNIGILEANPDLDKPPNKDEFNEKIFPKTATRWHDDSGLGDYTRRGRHWWTGDREKAKEISKRFWPAGSNKRRRYLDYTNSQMPFNEGKFRPKTTQVKQNKELQEPNKNPQEQSLEGFHEIENLLRSRFGRSLIMRLPEFQRSLRDADVQADDAILTYPRVRRFLDQQRAKKWIRSTSTLESKEAEMSRVLDPNINLDGILEPHVRKRRGRSTRKRDLSFRRRFRRKYNY